MNTSRLSLPHCSPRKCVITTGAALSLAFLWTAMQHLDWTSISRCWSSARPLPWALLSVGCYVGGHIARGQRLRRLVQHSAKLSLPTASNIVIAGYACNNVLPARIGEFARVGMLVERSGMPLAQALCTILIERVLDGLSVVALLLVSMALGFDGCFIWQKFRFSLSSLGMAAICLCALVTFPRVLAAAISRDSRRLGADWHDRIMRCTSSVLSSGAGLYGPLATLRVAMLSLLAWTLEAGMFLFLLPAIGLPCRFGTALAAMSVVNLSILLPSTPGYVGMFQTACAQTLLAFGTSPAAALRYASAVHITFYIPATLWGAAALLWYGIEFGTTRARARVARTSNVSAWSSGVPMHSIARILPERRCEKPTVFDLALAETFLSDFDSVNPVDVLRATQFTVDQISALPTRIRALYMVGMMTFRAYVRLRYGASFCRMSPTRRLAAVHDWAFGPLGLMRQLFRPLRTTLLLGYFDHLQSRNTNLRELGQCIAIPLPFSRSQKVRVRSAHG